MNGQGNRDETLVAGRHTPQGRNVAADDMAAALAYMVEEPPVHGVIELAGPESLPMAEFVGRYLAASGDTQAVVTDPQARYFGASVDNREFTRGPPPPRPEAIRVDGLSDGARGVNYQPAFEGRRRRAPRNERTFEERCARHDTPCA